MITQPQPMVMPCRSIRDNAGGLRPFSSGYFATRMSSM